MKLDWLKEIVGDGYTEEMDTAACKAVGERFVSRADFNARNEVLKTASISFSFPRFYLSEIPRRVQVLRHDDTPSISAVPV